MDFSSVIGSFPVPPTFTARSNATYFVIRTPYRLWGPVSNLPPANLLPHPKPSLEIILFPLLHVRHRFIDVLPAMDGLLLRQVCKHLHPKSSVQVIRNSLLPWPPHD